MTGMAAGKLLLGQLPGVAKGADSAVVITSKRECDSSLPLWPLLIAFSHDEDEICRWTQDQSPSSPPEKGV